MLVAATVLNIHESKRFKKGAFRFWGCLPVYDSAAARLAGRSDAWITARIAQVHMQAMDRAVSQLRAIAHPRPWLFANGETLMGCCRLAFAMGDGPAQNKHLAKVSKGCGVCMAPYEQLDATDQAWPARDCHDILQSLRLLAAECVNDEGQIRRGKKKVVKDWERRNRMRFGHNALLEMVEDLHYHVTLFTPRDFLHAIILGLFGYHIVRAIIYLIDSVIITSEFCSAHGGRPAPVPKCAVDNILKRLSRRMASVRADESCLTLTAEFAEHFLKVYKEGRSSFTGPRMNNIMLVLPYIIRDIAAPEIERINAAIDNAAPGDPLHGMVHVQDPCVKIVDCLLTFMRWYLLIRRRETSMDDVAEMLVRGPKMMESLKDTFPEKSGEDKAWNFGKFHDIIHLPLYIMLWGWIENTSGQSGESAHRELLKALQGCVNNKEVFMQFLRFWERLEQLARARLEDRNSAGSESESDADGEHRTETAEVMTACEIAVRCPLFYMTLHRDALHHRASSVRIKGSRLAGRQRLNVWELAHCVGKGKVTIPSSESLTSV